MLHLKSRARCRKTMNFIFIHLWTPASLKVCVIHFSFSEMSLNLMLNYTYLSFLKIIQDLLFINTRAGKYAAFKTEYHMTTSPQPLSPLPENSFISFWCVPFCFIHVHTENCVYISVNVCCVLEKMESCFERLTMFCVWYSFEFSGNFFWENNGSFHEKCKLQNVNFLDIAWKAIITKAKASKQTKAPLSWSII